MENNQMKQLDIELVELSEVKKGEMLEDGSTEPKDSSRLLMPGPCGPCPCA